MREYGVSALTSAISERSPSSSRIVRIAFMPAVPPPMMRCRVAIVTDSSRTAGARSQTRLAWRLRLARRPRDVLWLARPSSQARLGRRGRGHRLASPGGCGSHGGPATSCGSHDPLPRPPPARGGAAPDPPPPAAAAPPAAPPTPLARPPPPPPPPPPPRVPPPPPP